MKNIRVFLSENFQFWEVKFAIYLNMHVFVIGAVLFMFRLDSFSEKKEKN